MANIRDFAIGSVLTPPSPATSGTTLVLNSGEGPLMPSTTPYYLTVAPAGVIPTKSNSEKIKVTNRASDTLTIVRAQGETTAKSIDAGWIVVNSIYVDDLFSSSMVLDEALSGTVNGTNTVFTTSTAFTAITVNKNGVTLHQGDDYTITAANQITMVTAPATGTKLTASYITGSQVMISGSNSIIAKEGVQESPNGSLTTFTTARPYIGGTLQVYVNGLAQGGLYITETNPGLGTFTLDTAPNTGDNISVSYMYGASVTGNADTVDGFHASAMPTANTIPVLNAQAQSGEWWEEIGRATLGSASTTLTADFSPKRYLSIRVMLLSGNSYGTRLRFNNDSGANYTSRYSDNNGTSATITSSTEALIGTATANADTFIEAEIVNFSGSHKMIRSHALGTTTGAGTAPNSGEHFSRWASTAQVTSITIFAPGGTSTFGAGSEIVVLGHD